MVAMFFSLCLVFVFVHNVPIALAGAAQHQMAITTYRALALGRMDAIISPDTFSSHVHTFFGANNPSASMSFDTLRSSTCTTLGLGNADKSSYWVPSLYHRAPGGTSYTLLPVKSSTIYYNWNAGGNDTPFPDNFSMTVGNPAATSHRCSHGTPTSPTCQASDQYWYCGGGGDMDTAPRRACSNVGIHLTFPSCWDGQPFTKETQDQHLFKGTFHTGATICPAGTKKIPTLMYSISWDTAGIVPNPADEDTFVMSMGTSTGMHADFVNGWDPTVLSQVIKQCSDLGMNGPLNCPPLAPYVDKKTGNACKFAGVLPTEDVGIAGNALASLPGQANPSQVGTSCALAWAAPQSYTSTLFPVAANSSCGSSTSSNTQTQLKQASAASKASSKSPVTNGRNSGLGRRLEQAGAFIAGGRMQHKKRQIHRQEIEGGRLI